LKKLKVTVPEKNVKMKNLEKLSIYRYDFFRLYVEKKIKNVKPVLINLLLTALLTTRKVEK